ncbi:MAG: ATP-binding protein [Alphaproteobacteria bacterium]
MTEDAERPALSLSVRLVAGAMVWLGLMLAIGGGALALAFRETVEREFSHRLDAMLRGMIAATEIAPDGSVTLVRPLGDPRFEQVYSGWYWQLAEPSGRLVRSRSLWDAVIAPVDGGAELRTRRTVGPRDEALLVAERDLHFPGLDGPVHALIAGNTGEVQEGVRRFDLLLVSALGLLGAGLAVAILIQVRFGLRPLRAMAADLKAVRDGEQPRLSGHYPREVAPLARAMNDVLDKDAELIERARTHVGNLAHGLKTPLAVLSAEAESTPDVTVLRRQVQAMRSLIEHHLGRASAVAGAGRSLGVRVPVGEVAHSLAAILARVFVERNLSFTFAIPHTAWFRGHAEDLEEILGNLMENACKWAHSTVRVSAEDTGDGLVITVEDDGPGMTPEQAAEASRRGKRLDEMAPGWGLGLSIVSDLVELYGGNTAFGRSALGGLAVSVGFAHPRSG